MLSLLAPQASVSLRKAHWCRLVWLYSPFGAAC